MQIIVVSHARGRVRRLRFAFHNAWTWMPIAAAVVLVCGLSFAAGFSVRGPGAVLPEKLVKRWASEVGAQRMALEQTRARAEQDVTALSRRIAELDARMMRLDAAGERLTEIAGLDAGEFDFSKPPAVGGPDAATETGEPPLAGVLASLDAFERQLSDRERQMHVLEDLLLASRLQKEVSPSGWPVQSGYISSTYGWRVDPFKGRSAMHSGIDFAGADGSTVQSVASGIVSFVGPRSGYGLLVEINHGNGYVTRYAHNDKATVRVGEEVKKGERIALMGSTGRSTGTHVHFEVLLNGKVVDPTQYIQAAR